MINKPKSKRKKKTAENKTTNEKRISLYPFTPEEFLAKVLRTKASKKSKTRKKTRTK